MVLRKILLTVSCKKGNKQLSPVLNDNVMEGLYCTEIFNSNYLSKSYSNSCQPLS